MSVGALVTDARFRDALTSLMRKENMKCHFSESVEGLLENAMSSFPRIFIIQENVDSPLRILDLVNNLRELFGVVATIILIGQNMSSARMASLIGEGADNYFSYPFDIGLLEDFLFKSARKELCRPFKYRNVPSGKTSITIKLKILVTEINANGILFEANDFITSGVILSLDLNKLLNLSLPPVKVQVLRSEKKGTGRFFCSSEFFEIDADLRKKIIFSIKAV
ncbi:MAG: hypothetical protein ACLGHN_15780 [Bacteriovoracia bacterium]